MKQDKSLTIGELAVSAHVSLRTIRYYQQQGLLPSPGRRGPGSHYSLADLRRLRLIRRLQQDHIPLAEIRQRLRRMSDKEIEALVAEDGVIAAVVPAAGPARAERRVFGLARATWERIELAPDVELHVRRPLTLAQNRFIERLVEEARRTEE